MAQELYVVKQNSDLTEGRGSMRPIGYFDDIEDAVAFAQGKGVMGSGPGEVYQIKVLAKGEWTPGPLKAGNRKPFEEVQVYGYRKGRNGNYGYGYVDLRDQPDPKNDPEYSEYLRLRKKFTDS